MPSGSVVSDFVGTARTSRFSTTPKRAKCSHANTGTRGRWPDEPFGGRNAVVLLHRDQFDFEGQVSSG